MKRLIEYGIDHIGFIVPDVDTAIAHMKEHCGIQDVVTLSPDLKTAWTKMGCPTISSASAPPCPWSRTSVRSNYRSRRPQCRESGCYGSECEAVVLRLPDDAIVRSMTLGENGVLSGDAPRSVMWWTAAAST